MISIDFYLPTDFGPSEPAFCPLVLVLIAIVLIWRYTVERAINYESGSLISLEFHLNLLVLSFIFPKYPEWPFDCVNFFHSGLKYKAPGKCHSCYIANGCQPLNSRLRSRVHNHKDNLVWSRFLALNISIYYILLPYCISTFSTNIKKCTCVFWVILHISLFINNYVPKFCHHSL